MPSDNGLPELSPEQEAALRELTQLGHEVRTPLVEWDRFFDAENSLSPATTKEEEDRIADGEPYCFRCGKPASSFPEYRQELCEQGENCKDCAINYVLDEEGTYNPATNRFACDECYIAIGTPSTNTIEGWKAP